MDNVNDDEVTSYVDEVAMIHGEGDLLVPAHLNFGKFILDRLRKAKPDGVCLRNSTKGEQLSYREFAQYAVSLSSALTQLGVTRGVTVAVAGEPRITFLATGLAVVLTGAAYTPIPLGCGKAILTHKLNLTEPEYVICSRLFWEAYRDVLKGLDYIKAFICFDAIEDIALSIEAMVSSHVDVELFEPPVINGGTDVAVVLYSSGTTGMSKGVLLTHLNCVARCGPYGWYGFESLKTAYFSGEDQCGAYGIFPMYAFVCAEKTVVYSEDDIDLNIIQDYRVDAMPTVPAFVEVMLNANREEYDFSSLKVIYTGTMPLQFGVTKAFKKRYPNIKLLDLYGATEAHMITTQGPTADESTTVGVAAPGITIKVVDLETRKTLGVNQRGEICVRSPCVMKGYLGAKSAYMDEQGFYLTGDLGYYDEHKRFYLLGRLHDVIHHHLGYKVPPGDVEEVLLRHEAVREAAVVGAPASGGGERPVAFVVLQPGAAATEAQLVAYVSQQVTWYMQLTGGIRFVSELPRSPQRKVLRRRLKEMLALEQI